MTLNQINTASVSLLCPERDTYTTRAARMLNYIHDCETEYNSNKSDATAVSVRALAENPENPVQFADMTREGTWFNDHCYMASSAPEDFAIRPPVPGAGKDDYQKVQYGYYESLDYPMVLPAHPPEHMRLRAIPTSNAKSSSPTQTEATADASLTDSSGETLSWDTSSAGWVGPLSDAAGSTSAPNSWPSFHEDPSHSFSSTTTWSQQGPTGLPICFQPCSCLEEKAQHDDFGTVVPTCRPPHNYPQFESDLRAPVQSMAREFDFPPSYGPWQRHSYNDTRPSLSFGASDYSNHMPVDADQVFEIASPRHNSPAAASFPNSLHHQNKESGGHSQRRPGAVEPYADQHPSPSTSTTTEPNAQPPRSLPAISATTTSSNATLATRDAFLIRCRAAGLSYREIRERGHFALAESTLRGRFRALTKPKPQRVRAPRWTDADVRLLHDAVAVLTGCKTRRRTAGPSSASLSASGARANRAAPKLHVPWKRVADYIASRGGSYHFGNATCRKKWDEICGR